MRKSPARQPFSYGCHQQMASVTHFRWNIGPLTPQPSDDRPRAPKRENYTGGSTWMRVPWTFPRWTPRRALRNFVLSLASASKD
jgi:hypothetical protein